MQRTREYILIFSKYPQAGVCKTRLIPALGAEGAASLHKELTEMTINTVTQFSKMQNQKPRDFMICYQGAEREKMQAWLGHELTYQQQQGDDLGERMLHAVNTVVAENRSSSILLVGTDCPDLDTAILQEAMESLLRKNLVLGPACDGGYYLIGFQGSLAKNALTALFTEITWGSSKVFAQTMERIKQASLSCHLLKKLHDIDRPEDLVLLEKRS